MPNPRPRLEGEQTLGLSLRNVSAALPPCFPWGHPDSAGSCCGESHRASLTLRGSCSTSGSYGEDVLLNLSVSHTIGVMVPVWEGGCEN